MNRVRDHLNSYYVITHDFNLNVPPWKTGTGWVPIGNGLNPFQGSLNGDNYTISNLFIDTPNATKVGLFAAIEEALIQDLNLSDLNIDGEEFVGGLCGYAELSDIINVTVEGVIIGHRNAGGLIGESKGNWQYGNVDNCVAHVQIIYSLREDLNDPGFYYATIIGGLVGSNKGCLIDNCQTYGTISGLIVEAQVSSIGGLVGYNNNHVNGEGRVHNSNSSIEISINNPLDGLIGLSIGGLIGWSEISSNNTRIVYNCYSSGSINGTKDVGGLIGANQSHVENCYSMANTNGLENIGGLIGSNTRPILNCYSLGNVSGADKTGGLIGQNPYGGLVDKCYSTGQVSGDTNIGGLIGLNGGMVTNSYWDIESSGQESSAGATDPPQNNYQGLTTVKMLQEESFINWDFDGQEEIWAIEEWYTEPYSTYPYLQWQTAGQDPIGFEHNKPVNEELKLVSNSGYHWVSFPWLSRDQLLEQNPERMQTAEEALRPVNNNNIGYIDQVTYWNASVPGFEEMEWIPLTISWSPDDIERFSSTQGFIIEVSEQDPFNIPFYGVREDPDTEFTLWPGAWDNGNFIYNENWIGYFLTDAQDFEDGLGAFIGSVNSIQSQYGGMYRISPTQFIGTGVTLAYGEMFKVTLVSGVDEPIDNFHWNIPRSRSQYEREALKKEKPKKPEHFEISYGPKYESIFITEIADDEDVVEIGVYANGVCIGASVFTESYPLEILAYTNDTHLNEALTFVLYLDDESYERYDTVPVQDLDTGQYSRQSLNPLEGLFSIVKLDRVGAERSLAVEEQVDEIPQPALVLSQNYPNPFSLSTGIQGNHTTISLSLPQEMPVSLNIYNIRGQLVRNLVSGEVNKGEHTVGWNGKDENNKTVSSGIYFYRLETEDKTLIRKMLIVR